MLHFLSIFIYIVLYFSIAPIEGVLITTKYGILDGKSMKSRNGTEYLAFLEIPFAKPPVGDLRFESPQDMDKWEGVRNATRQPSPCIQYNRKLKKYLGEEDCLYLNVFTPRVPASGTSSLLPTMVYIFGGAFIRGSASEYDPAYIMDNSIVVVIIQYRLHVLGFLSAADEVLPGNNGMKDQVAALKWVQENIANFGGDPKRVTIFGQSAGGSSVHLHMYSALSKGLFQQAISQSGSALGNLKITTPQLARQKAQTFAVLSGCPFEPTSAFVKCLRKISADELIRIHNKFYVWRVDPIIPFPIVIENKNVKDAFLVENPWHVDLVSDVPWISGLVKNEGGFKVTQLLSNPSVIRYYDSNYERLFPITFRYGEWLNDKDASTVSKKLRQFYFGEESMEKQPKKVEEFFTDGYFSVDIVEAAKRSTSKAYFYLYDHKYDSDMKIFGTYEYEDLGVRHSDDLISFFRLSMFPEVTEGPDFEVSKKMIKYWVNFATKGNPNGEENIWQPIKSEEVEYLHIMTETDVMEKNLFLERRNFWMSLPVFRNSDSHHGQTS